MRKNYIVIQWAVVIWVDNNLTHVRTSVFPCLSSWFFSLLLDDEEETAEGEKEGNEVEDEELDPLDAYMEEVKEEVKKFNMRSVKGGGGSEKVKSLVKYFLLLKDFVF